MIKILIADDEDYIRQGMRYTIPWEEHGMEIVGEASNGQEALQAAIRLTPDIILADIQMPLMNGLELAGKLNDLLPNTKVIILTAYGSTQNLTSAIDVKVSSFLLKSADSSKILETVIHVKDEVSALRAQNQKTAHIKDIYEENHHLIKATLMSRFLQNHISYSYFEAKTNKMGFRLDQDTYSLALIKVNCIDEKLVLGNLLQHFSKFQPFAFFIQNQHAMLVLNTSKNQLTTLEMDLLLPGILPVTFGNCIVIFNHVSSVEEFPLIYSVLSKALDHCFWNTDRLYTLLEPFTSITTDSEINSYEYESTLISAIVGKNTAQIQLKLDSYYDYMKCSKVSRKIFLESVTRLIVLICAVSEDKQDVKAIYDLIDELETPKEIIDLIGSLTVPNNPSSSIHSQVGLALSYIDKHYTEDVHLEDAAKAAYLSSGYLSRIFKSETGYSFKEYVHKLRISKAQELVGSTDMKYYEIAEKVGYRDYKYFSSYFSKITGCSAKEYRSHSLLR